MYELSSYKMFAYIEKQKPEPFLAIQVEYWPSESEEGKKDTRNEQSKEQRTFKK